MPATKRTATGVLGGLAGLVGLSAVAGLLVTATVTPAIAVSGAAASSAISLFDKMPDYLDIDELMLPTKIFYKDQNGNDQLLAQFYDQNRVQKEYDQINPLVYDAVLSSEDPRYYAHGGIDLIGTSRALLNNVAGSGQVQGGSSISQQYVKNVLVQRCETTAESPEAALECWGQATTAEGTEGMQRKLQEMRYAIALEQRYSKNEILLGYLNIANFGGTTYGVGAAAQYYFGVDAADLSLVQAATLAGMVQNPNTFAIDKPAGSTVDRDGNAINSADDGYALTKDRRNSVLRRMAEEGKITQAEADAARAEPVTPAINPQPQGCQMAGGSAYFCDYVKTIVQNDPVFGDTPEERAQKLKRSGYSIYTTLDIDLQLAAEEAIKVVPQYLDFIDIGGAGVQVEVGTGRVLSMVQNKNYTPGASDDPTFSAVNFNTRKANGSSTGFPAGSTYKMFTLLNWLEQGNSVNEVLDGRKRDFRIDQGCDDGIIKIPTVGNFQGSQGYLGTPMKFTADSLNTGFYAMSERVSVCDTHHIADRLGVVQSGQYKTYEVVPGSGAVTANNPYSVLGSEAVAPLDMAGAYATVAAGGIHCEPKAIDRIVDAAGNEVPVPETKCERVLSEDVANTAAYALKSVINGGSAASSNPGDGTPVFGKTGIHEQLQTWMDGSSTEVATVVWVGNIQGEVSLERFSTNGWAAWRLRHAIWPVMQRAANAKYGGEQFGAPAKELTRPVYRDLPSVIGKTVEEATQIIEAAGFSVEVLPAVDGTQAAGLIETQTPGAGRVAGGVTVQIAPSNGQGTEVPDGIVGASQKSAVERLRGAGLNDISVDCVEKGGDDDDRGKDEGKVTAVDPASGTSVTKSTKITITVEKKRC